ncbi:hypothetical protein [Cryobacterium gelidum]|uniref:Uncharacterized protein n=1 Tax=Cryobacterium gelidum TaxID=1259164 RepID=A0A4R9B087_9MICO|nr:hypothetical protein [Cryobacterium gelidum]TFD73685.1 hypothetical protein E3T50_01790 [Cryobacterium gelidum]
MNSYVSNTTTLPNEFISHTARRIVTGSGYVSGTAQHLDAGEYVSRRRVTSAPTPRVATSQVADSRHLAAAA